MQAPFKAGDKVRALQAWGDMHGVDDILTVNHVFLSGHAWYLRFEELRGRYPHHNNHANKYTMFLAAPDTETKPPPAPPWPPTTKDGNPKEAIGASKLAFHLVPDTLGAYAATAFYEGASKYGAYNWRVAGVRASTYKAAAERHIRKWFNGQDHDPATKVHHLANAIACLGIILDAEVAGKLNDDRPPSVDLDGLIEALTKTQAHVQELNKACNPTHHTQK